MIKFARFILSNLLTLLLSLILAFLIWVNASQTEDPIQDRWLQIPVAYVGQPENSILLSARRQNVQIFFEGPGSIVDQLGAGDFSASVDLSQVPFGEEVPVTIRVQAKNPITKKALEKAFTIKIEQKEFSQNMQGDGESEEADDVTVANVVQFVMGKVA